MKSFHRHPWTGLLLLALGLSSSLRTGAQGQTSANYALESDGVFAGGLIQLASANYALRTAVDAMAAARTLSANYAGRSTFLGQNYRITGAQVVPGQIPEVTTNSVAVQLILDDDTFLPALGNATLSPLPPVLSLDLAGIAMAGAVFQNTPVTVGLAAADGPVTTAMMVVDTIPDNFGTYAGDGLPDDWQVQFFGPNNPNAGPNQDPDGDGQNNTFEYTAGLVPTDAASRFRMEIVREAGAPVVLQLRLEPTLTGHQYLVQKNPGLLPAGWSTLLTFIPSAGDGPIKLIPLPLESSAQFYRVQISQTP